MIKVEKIHLCAVVVTIASLLSLSGCQGVQNGPAATQADLKSINHIIFLAQENRSLDTYFGQLSTYWAANGFPAQQFDGLPADASNPSFDGTTTISAYHLATVCTQNLSPSWNESHVDWNRTDPTSATATMDGFVHTAAAYAMNAPAEEAPIFDVDGVRAMGYYDGNDLNYYYFMASNFATSDRWFSPVMDRTQLNRAYLIAGTSQGHAYPPGANPAVPGPFTAPTIFEALDKAGITWKVYATDLGASGEDPATYLSMFAVYSQLPPNVVPASEFLTDAQNGTLPQVAMIEGGYNSGLDEHPKNNIQVGAQYAASLINGLMSSPSWKDSVFILTYDEAGGLYDHVPPQPAVSPDGISPIDLFPNDICTTPGGANCDFNYTGFRVPLLVVSPFAKKNYVSHTIADYTAILKLIETRFDIAPLTQRDAAQMDMTEFFDFQNMPWATPPSPPAQTTSGICDYQKLQ